jgi:hypothetical protein
MDIRGNCGLALAAARLQRWSAARAATAAHQRHLPLPARVGLDARSDNPGPAQGQQRHVRGSAVCGVAGRCRVRASDLGPAQRSLHLSQRSDAGRPVRQPASQMGATPPRAGDRYLAVKLTITDRGPGGFSNDFTANSADYGWAGPVGRLVSPVRTARHPVTPALPRTIHHNCAGRTRWSRGSP